MRKRPLRRPLVLLGVLLMVVASCTAADDADTPTTIGDTATTVGSTAPDADPTSPYAVVRAGIISSDDLRAGGHLVTGVVFEPSTLNPNLAFDDAAARIAAMIYSPLVVTDLPHLTPNSPALADSWEISDDAMEYTFYLAEEARWHDGEPVTADDVKWTIDMILENSGRLSGAELATVSTVDVIDPHTVRVSMSEPNAAFLANMGVPYTLFILPKHLMEGVPWEDNIYLTEPVGSGPFKFVEWVRGSHITVEANDDFFLGRPAIDRITMRLFNLPSLIEAFRSGEVKYSYDRLPSSELASLSEDSTYRIHMMYLPQTEWVGFKLDNPKFQDVRVREAFAIAIDREEISRRAHQTMWAPNFGVLPRGSVYNDEAEFEYDPERAIQLLEEAGFLPDADGVRLRAVYSHGTVLSQDISSPIMQEQLRQVGIELTLDPMDFPTYSQVVIDRGEYEIRSGGGFVGGDPDQMSSYIVSDGHLNNMGYNNPRVDELFRLARQTVDFDTRRGYYLEAQELIFEDIPRFNVLDVGNNHPVWSCVQLPWFDERLANERYNVWTGFLYTWLDEGCQ